jgi:hypothetical protein
MERPAIIQMSAPLTWLSCQVGDGYGGEAEGNLGRLARAELAGDSRLAENATHVQMLEFICGSDHNVVNHYLGFLPSRKCKVT